MTRDADRDDAAGAGAADRRTCGSLHESRALALPVRLLWSEPKPSADASA